MCDFSIMVQPIRNSTTYALRPVSYFGSKLWKYLPNRYKETTDFITLRITCSIGVAQTLADWWISMDSPFNHLLTILLLGTLSVFEISTEHFSNVPVYTYNIVCLCAHGVRMWVCMWFLSGCAKVTLHMQSPVVYKSMLFMCNLFLTCTAYFCTSSYNSLVQMFVVCHMTLNLSYLILFWGMNKLYHPTLFLTCDSLSMLALNWNYVSKKSP